MNLTEYRDGSGDIPLGAIPRYHAERKPDSALALVHPGESLTWWELEARSNQRARLYRSLGVKPGDFVTLGLPNGNAFFEATFAIWKLGATPNVVSAKLPEGEARAIVELARPSLLIAEEGDWPEHTARVSGSADLSGIDPAAIEPVAPARYWKALMSGGSTGRPKIIVDHKPATTNPSMSVFNQPGDGAVLNPGPLYHSTPFALSHTALFRGNTLVGLERFEAESVLRLIQQYRIQWAIFVPTMMHRILALSEQTRARYDLSSLEHVWHGAAAIPAWLKEAWINWLGPEKIWEAFGGSEAQGGTLIQGTEWLQHRGSVGRVIPGCSLKILRDDGSECDVGEVGGIYFLPHSGPGSTYHYLGAEPHRVQGGWETVGDMGHVDEHGYLYLADRRTDLILRGGANIYPAEVEAAIEAFPGVASAAVIGLPHEELGREVHAIVELRDGPVDLQELARFIARRVLKYKLPASYEIVVGPLRNEAGKIRRAALRDEREHWTTQQRNFRLYVSI